MKKFVNWNTKGKFFGFKNSNLASKNKAYFDLFVFKIFFYSNQFRRALE